MGLALRRIFYGLGAAALASYCGVMAIPISRGGVGEEPFTHGARGRVTQPDGGTALRLWDGAHVFADEFSYDGKILLARGNVRICLGRDLVLANDLTFDLNGRRISGSGIRAGINGIFLEALSMDSDGGDENSHTIFHGSRLFYGEPGPFTPNISAEKMTLIGRRRLRFDGAFLRLGKHRFGFIGHHSQPIAKFPLCVRGEWGHRESVGFFGEQVILWRITHDLRLGSDLDYYSKRGLLLGPRLEIHHSAEEHSLDLDVRGGWIDDSGWKDSKKRGRHFVDVRFRNSVDASWLLVGEFHRWSDPFVERDFRPNSCEDNQVPESYLELNHWDDNSLFSIFLRGEPNDFHGTTQCLPEVRYQIFPRKVFGFSPLLEGFLDLAHIRGKNDSLAGSHRSFLRGDGHCAVRFPLRLVGAISLSPSAAGRLIICDGGGAAEGSAARWLGQLGMDLDYAMDGLWNFSLPRWGIGGIHHHLSPTVQYRWTFSSGGSGVFFPNRLPDYFQPPTIDLGSIEDLEDISDGSCLRLGLRNFFQTPAAGKSERTLMQLNFYQDLHLPRPTNGHCLSDMWCDLSLSPAPFFSAKFFGCWDPYSLSPKKFHGNVSLWDGIIWNLSFGYEHVPGGEDQCRVGFCYNFNSFSQLRCSWCYDLGVHRLLEQHYRIQRRMTHAWLLQARLMVRSHAICRGDRFHFSVGMSLER
jgi:LPS-assembly protein